jgi:hypothetical protein
MGKPVKALKTKALPPAAQQYQQSYPQKSWMKSKDLMDQALKPHSTSSHQQRPPNGGIQ